MTINEIMDKLQGRTSIHFSDFCDIQITVLWDVTSCSMADGHQQLRRRRYHISQDHSFPDTVANQRIHLLCKVTMKA
jgi:hypothetical protein